MKSDHVNQIGEFKYLTCEFCQIWVPEKEGGKNSEIFAEWLIYLDNNSIKDLFFSSEVKYGDQKYVDLWSLIKKESGLSLCAVSWKSYSNVVHCRVEMFLVLDIDYNKLMHGIEKSLIVL